MERCATIARFPLFRPATLTRRRLGQLFVISHDEHLINAVCNELWVLDEGRLVNFDGDFDDYKKVVRKKYGF